MLIFCLARAEGARKISKIRKRLLRIFEPPKTWSKTPPYLRAKSTNRGGVSTIIRPDLMPSRIKSLQNPVTIGNVMGGGVSALATPLLILKLIQLIHLNQSCV